MSRRRFIPGLATVKNECADWTPHGPSIDRGIPSVDSPDLALGSSVPVDWRVVASVLIVAFLVLSSVAVFMLPVKETVPAQVTYTPHLPITITQDDDFVTQGWLGGGTVLNPYIIRDLDITAAGNATAISISNTKVHFVIDSCYLHNASTAQIRLTNVKNGTLHNNICQNLSYGSYGIYLLNSRDNLVANNNCSYSDMGIYLESSSYNAVENNTCYANSEYGIEVYLSGYDELFNNTCIANQYYGMFVLNSNHIKVDNNTCASNYDKGMYMYHATFSNITVNRCIGNAYEGLYMENADDSQVVGNNCSGNKDGVYMTVSSRVQLVANKFILNNNIGIILSSSDNDVFDRNNCSRDGVGGIYLESSNGHRVTNNTCSISSGYGIRLYSSSSCLFDHNNCTSLGGYGLFVESSANDMISNNTLRSTNRGIEIRQSTAMTIYNNTISHNFYAGIHLNLSLRNRLLHNTLVGNGVMIDGNQISHWNSHKITADNTVNGRILRYLSNVSGQTVPLGAGQVILANSTNIVVSGQNLSDASSGIEAGYCSGITIVGSLCTNGTYGIRLNAVNLSIVSYNHLSWNQFDGALLVNVDNCTVNGNNISSNLEYGLRVDGSRWNDIVGNRFLANAQYGVYLGANLSATSTTVRNRVWNNSFAFNAGTTGTPNPSLSQAFEATGMNYWNSSGTPHGYGNYWRDWTTPDGPPKDGIVDEPYSVSGHADSKDYFPLTTPPEPVIPIPEMSVVFVAPLMALVVGALAWRRRET